MYSSLIHEFVFQASKEVTATLFIKFWSVKEIGEALPPFGFAQMGFDGKVAKPLCLAAIRCVLMFQENISSPYKDNRDKDYCIQLPVQWRTEVCQGKPYSYNGEIDDNLGQGRDTMTDTYAHKSVMKVCLVGSKRTMALHDAHGHDTESVKHGHCKESKYHGRGTDLFTYNICAAIICEDIDHKPCHEHSHNHSAGITNEHTTLIAKDIVYEEQEQGCCHTECHDCVYHISLIQEGCAE